MPVTFKDIEAARATLKGNVVRTPLLKAPKLSEITGADIYVKFENLQVTSSFKVVASSTYWMSVESSS